MVHFLLDPATAWIIIGGYKIIMLVGQNILIYKYINRKIMSHFVDGPEGLQLPAAQTDEQNTVNVDQQSITEEQKFHPPFNLRFLVGYLYFLQGIIVSLPQTMTMVYPQLPPYNILSVFSVASLPFSMKFIVAPFIQKFTKISYGKRKTWIIISQFSASIVLLLASFFTDQKYQIIMAVFLILTIFLITLQDISLDAMAIKQLKLPYLVGFLQAIMQTSGVILGSLLLLKLTSIQFAENIGLTEPICHPSLVFRIFSAIVLLTTFFIHFSYTQTTLPSQKTVNKKKFCEILKFYRIFFDSRTKYCRTTLLFLIYLQGFNFFQAGYEYELIKAGLKRNTFNTISNFSLIPISILACFLSQKIQKFGILRSFVTYMILRQTLAFFIVSFFPTSIVPICFIYFSNQALEVFRFLVIGILVNSFPVNGISGMLITMLVSGANFGALKTIPLLLTGKLGWRVCASMGLMIQLCIICIFPSFFRKAEEGTINIDLDINEEEESVELYSNKISEEIEEQGQEGKVLGIEEQKK